MNIRSSVKIFMLLTVIAEGIFSQNIKLTGAENISERTLVNHSSSSKKISIIKTEESINEAMLEKKLYEFELSNRRVEPKNIPYKFDIVSSFRSNIRYGGFWDKYAIINFTPEMYIKPFDFISVYAIRNMSFWVPIDGIKQNFRSMALRSAAILAADNSVKLFLRNEKVLGPVVGFLLKNFFLYLVNKTEKDSDSKNDLKNYDNHYYAVSIRF